MAQDEPGRAGMDSVSASAEPEVRTALAADPPPLQVRNLCIAFGGIRAVEDLSFDVPARSILALIGPNGAGKTTVLNAISGFVRARGSATYHGRELLRLPAYRRPGLGIGRTFQNLQLFGELSLLENVLVGRHAAVGGNPVSDLLGFPVARREAGARSHAMGVLARLGLEAYAHRQARALPFGIQKLAGVARALAAEPALLLLDEPAAGLNRAESERLGETIAGLRADLGLTILLVEHNMRLVMDISDRIVVLDEGHKLAEGPPAEISRNPAVIEAYLGAVDRDEVMQEVQHELADRA